MGWRRAVAPRGAVLAGAAGFEWPSPAEETPPPVQEGSGPVGEDLSWVLVEGVMLA